MLKERYEQFIVKNDNESTNVIELIETESKIDEKHSDGDDNNLVEVFFVTDDFEGKTDDANEQYELLEVSQSDSDTHLDHASEPIFDEGTYDKLEDRKSSVDKDSLPKEGSKETSRIIDAPVNQCQTRHSKLRSVHAERDSSKKSKIATEKCDDRERADLAKTAVKLRKITHLSKALNVNNRQEGDRRSTLRRKLPSRVRKSKESSNSDEEFAARDSDNDDWPAPETLNEFPKEIIRDGLLIVKGKKLTSMIGKYVAEVF